MCQELANGDATVEINVTARDGDGRIVASPLTGKCKFLDSQSLESVQCIPLRRMETDSPHPAEDVDTAATITLKINRPLRKPVPSWYREEKSDDTDTLTVNTLENAKSRTFDEGLDQLMEGVSFKSDDRDDNRERFRIMMIDVLRSDFRNEEGKRCEGVINEIYLRAIEKIKGRVETGLEEDIVPLSSRIFENAEHEREVGSSRALELYGINASHYAKETPPLPTLRCGHGHGTGRACASAQGAGKNLLLSVLLK